MQQKAVQVGVFVAVLSAAPLAYTAPPPPPPAPPPIAMVTDPAPAPFVESQRTSSDTNA